MLPLQPALVRYLVVWGEAASKPNEPTTVAFLHIAVPFEQFFSTSRRTVPLSIAQL
jgi:hypothetical protein